MSAMPRQGKLPFSLWPLSRIFAEELKTDTCKETRGLREVYQQMNLRLQTSAVVLSPLFYSAGGTNLWEVSFDCLKNAVYI